MIKINREEQSNDSLVACYGEIEIPHLCMWSYTLKIDAGKVIKEKLIFSARSNF